MTTHGGTQSNGGAESLRLRRWVERFRQSLFFLPALFVLASLILATGIVSVDRRLSAGLLPEFFVTTVDNARSILSTVAGGTIAAASVVFSLTLIAVQLASSQFSPRVIGGFLSDRFQQVVMGLVVGTFAYCLLVLRSVRAPLDTETGAPFLPQMSVLLAIILGVASLLAVLASIDHTAKVLRVGALLNRTTADTLATITRRYPELDAEGDAGSDGDAVNGGALAVNLPGVTVAPLGSSRTDPAAPPADALTVTAAAAGWVTQISVDGLAEAIPDDSTLLLETAVGTYLIPSAPFARVWPVADEERDRVISGARAAVEISQRRTMQQDVAFGVMQLVDVGLRALSPGINDPNTASEAVVRLGTVLGALMTRDLTPQVFASDSRTVMHVGELTHSDYIDAAIEPLRRYARTEPRVLETIVRTLAMVRATVDATGHTSADLSGIDDQLQAIASELDALETPADRRRVVEALRDVGVAAT